MLLSQIALLIFKTFYTNHICEGNTFRCEIGYDLDLIAIE